jgi:hypothetical protein
LRESFARKWQEFMTCGLDIVFGWHNTWLRFFLVPMILLGVSSKALTQEKGKYLPGLDNRLEMIVHIIGEVKRPGKYRVTDDTNLIELLSEAGGPTEFSNLKAVTVAHVESEMPMNGKNGNYDKSQRLIKYNIGKYLEADNSSAPPILKPGDVILVPSNKWRTWRNIATMVRDVAVVASAYFLYLRSTRD